MIFQFSKLPFFILLILFSASAWCEGLIYKCKNDQGEMIYQKSPCSTNTETVTSWKPKEPKLEDSIDEDKSEEDKNNLHELKLKQNSGGHFTTEGSINDKGLTFVIDTGASFVSLPEFIAHSANIYCDDKIDMNTANGKADACTAKIKTLVFGSFQVNNVAAVIVPNLGQPLLGMNVLQMFNISQGNGEMRISYQKKEKSGEKNEAENSATDTNSQATSADSAPMVSESDTQSP